MGLILLLKLYRSEEATAILTQYLPEMTGGCCFMMAGERSIVILPKVFDS